MVNTCNSKVARALRRCDYLLISRVRDTCHMHVHEHGRIMHRKISSTLWGISCSHVNLHNIMQVCMALLILLAIGTDQWSLLCLALAVGPTRTEVWIISVHCSFMCHGPLNKETDAAKLDFLERWLWCWRSISLANTFYAAALTDIISHNAAYAQRLYTFLNLHTLYMCSLHNVLTSCAR